MSTGVFWYLCYNIHMSPIHIERTTIFRGKKTPNVAENLVISADDSVGNKLNQIARGDTVSAQLAFADIGNNIHLAHETLTRTASGILTRHQEYVVNGQPQKGDESTLSAKDNKGNTQLIHYRFTG